MIQKKTYLSPVIEVIKIENEGIIASSVNAGGYTPEMWSSTKVGNSHSAAHSSAYINDLEDMISDILQTNN